MKKLLHMIATPRGAESRTLKIFADVYLVSAPMWNFGLTAEQKAVEQAAD